MTADLMELQSEIPRPEAVLLGSHGVFGFSYEGAAGSTVGAIILNGGLLHNVGPFRLNCDIAAAMNAGGMPIFRMDQSGKGETPNRKSMARRDVLLKDYDDVFEHLHAKGVDRTILIGLCSGADDAIQIADSRDSVAGMVMLDGYAPRDFGYFWQAYGRKFLNARVWLRLLTGQYLRRDPKRNDGGADQIDIRDWDDGRTMQRKISAFLERGGKILTLFTGGVPNYYNHVGQLRDSIKNADRITEEYESNADHTYRLAVQRRRLVERIANWTEAEF